MKLSRTSHYAVIALVYLGQHRGKLVASHEIAKAAGVPEEFLRKVLQNLVRAGVLDSLKGPTGGLGLIRPAKAITLLDVIETMEGPLAAHVDGANLAEALVRRLLAVYELTTAKTRRRLAQVTIAKLAEML